MKLTLTENLLSASMFISLGLYIHYSLHDGDYLSQILYLIGALMFFFAALNMAAHSN